MELGTERVYNNEGFPNRDDVIRWEVIEIPNHQRVMATCLRMNSSYIQGVRFMIDGEFIIGGKRKSHFEWWFSRVGEKFSFECNTNSGVFSFYNIFNKDEKGHLRGKSSLTPTSGMILENKKGLLIYHCNDVGDNADFTSLIFHLKLE